MRSIDSSGITARTASTSCKPWMDTQSTPRPDDAANRLAAFPESLEAKSKPSTSTAFASTSTTESRTPWLFRGTEITSGGQREHTYDALVRNLAQRHLDPAGFASYLEVFRHGMPPHGGFAIGAERLTALLLGVPNIRFARAFPRDGQRLQP